MPKQTTNEEVEITQHEQAEEVINITNLLVKKENGEINKSASIRKMYREGLTKGEIAKALGIRYQFVYNVLNQKD